MFLMLMPYIVFCKSYFAQFGQQAQSIFIGVANIDTPGKSLARCMLSDAAEFVFKISNPRV